MTDVVENLQNEEKRHSNSTVKKINNLLNSSQTRVSGLELLASYLPECSDQDFIEWCVRWMHHCCKTDSSAKGRETSILVLNELLKISSNYSELKKSVSFFITTRYFDHFFKYYKNSQAGWSSAQTCFLLYKGACGPFQGAIAEHLNSEVDKNVKILPMIAECCALLPCLGGGGNEAINYKTNWKCQFIKFVNVCHSILNDLLVGVVEELQEFDAGGHSYNKKNVEVNAEFLTVQLHNYCAILSFMLLNKYPTSKCVPTDSVLEMICRGLAVNPSNLGQSRASDVMSLQKVLPEVHSILHSLLRALVVTCGTQLLPYAHLVAKLVRQTLEWTDGEFVYGSEKAFASLRISAYETLCNWLVATRSGSCVETISKVVVSNAVGDFQSKKAATLLKESKRKEQSQGKGSQQRRVDTSANSVLCCAALKALQFVIKFLGVSLKVEEHKFLQEVVIKLLVDIQNSSNSDILIPYSVAACRKELYSLLLELIHQPCATHPPPTHFALRIFSRGQNDASFAVSHFCSSAINVITSITHSQFDNGGFAVAERHEREERMQWSNEAVEVESKGDRSLGREVEAAAENDDNTEAENDENTAAVNDDNTAAVNDDNTAAENDDNTAESGEDWGEKLSNQGGSDVPSCEDSIETVNFKADENGKDVVEAVKEENVSVADEKHTESDSEPASKKCKTDESESSPLEKAPSPVKSTSPETLARDATPQKQSPPQKEEGKSGETEDTSSESPGDDRARDPRKRYFLRSKTSKSSSEEPDATASPEPFRTPTPTRSLGRTPSSLAKNRPRTRALSKIEDENEGTPSKNEGNDEDEDIIDSFNDSFVD